ncbi:MAG: putative ABC transporter permease [Clostridia bacterium]
MEILHTIEIYFLLFITYAFFGWLMEVICKLIQEKRFINRGFLIGPYCPIYGWGALAITILLKKYLDDPIALFFMSVIICSVIEYLTSYILEKKYHARWWDYSNKKYNINGRICLETLIPFGLLGMIISYFTNPVFFNWYSSLSDIGLHIISGLLLLTFITDNIISSRIVAAIKAEGIKATKDNTEEITQFVKQKLKEKSMLHRRLINAFPNMKDIHVKLKK